MATAVALVSGGCESAVMLSRLARRFARVYPLYVKSGLAWETAELAHLRRFLRAARLPRLAPLLAAELPVADVYGPHWSVTGRGVPGARSDDRRMRLPGRNLLLIGKAAVLAGIRRSSAVAIGSLRSNPFSDATPAFRRVAGRSATLAMGRPISVIAPFARWTKAEVLRAGSRLPLHLTFSCASPARDRHCGRCNKCAERRRAFARAGIPDRTPYGPRRRG